MGLTMCEVDDMCSLLGMGNTGGDFDIIDISLPSAMKTIYKSRLTLYPPNMNQFKQILHYGYFIINLIGVSCFCFSNMHIASRHCVRCGLIIGSVGIRF